MTAHLDAAARAVEQARVADRSTADGARLFAWHLNEAVRRLRAIEQALARPPCVGPECRRLSVVRGAFPGQFFCRVCWEARP